MVGVKGKMILFMYYSHSVHIHLIMKMSGPTLLLLHAMYLAPSIST